MKSKFSDPQSRLFLVAAVILTIGLSLSAYLYLAAERMRDTAEYELELTKKSLRDMEMIGGKSNVLSSRFSHWFDGLWHGKPLALILAAITILVYFVLYRIARGKPPIPK